MTIKDEASQPPLLPKPRERRYVRLPANNELFALWKEKGYSYAETAEAIGCSSAAIQMRVKRAGLAKPESIRRFRPPVVDPTKPTDSDRIKVLENSVRKLQNRVRSLEKTVNKDQPDHKRIVDGGEHAKTQRNRAKQPKIA